ncbi:MAG: hypothetical protein OXH20_11040 [bacterium]|nr:hypothetical protein [bacterium]
MEVSQLEFIIAWVSILGTTVAAVLAAFGFLHRERRDGFKRHEARMDRQDEKLEQLTGDVTDLKVSVARIEGCLGIGFRSADDQAEPSEPPERAA